MLIFINMQMMAPTAYWEIMSRIYFTSIKTPLSVKQP